MKLIEINGEVGVAEVTGVQRNVHLQMVEHPQVGDYVMVHAGFAIQIMAEQEAQETIRLLQELQIATQ